LQVYPIPGFFEPFGSMIHLIGAGVFAVLTFFLIRRGRGDGRRVTVLAVFSLSCVLLLSMSGVYHMLREPGTARAVLGRLDLAAIFVLIAGTHTPVQAFFFRGTARWGVLAFMWLLAATGITLFSVFYHTLPRGLGTTIYLTLGWIAGAAGVMAWRRYGTSEVKLLLLGGVAYSVGAILMGMGWPTIIPGVVGPHEIWHIAVLVAMSMHWTFVFRNAHRNLDGPAHR
jgi:channel protein (hemolysin III family)